MCGGNGGWERHDQHKPKQEQGQRAGATEAGGGGAGGPAGETKPTAPRSTWHGVDFSDVAPHYIAQSVGAPGPRLRNARNSRSLSLPLHSLGIEGLSHRASCAVVVCWRLCVAAIVDSSCWRPQVWCISPHLPLSSVVVIVVVGVRGARDRYIPWGRSERSWWASTTMTILRTSCVGAGMMRSACASVWFVGMASPHPPSVRSWTGPALAPA